MPKIPTVKLRLFTKNNPVTVCRDGTYHAIVRRARQPSAIVAVIVGYLHIYASALYMFSTLIDFYQ